MKVSSVTMLVLFLLSWAGCSTQKSSSGKSSQAEATQSVVPDSIVVHRLGDSLTTILFEPESAVAYVLLQPSDARSAKKKFVRTSSRQLSPEQKEVLYTALINNPACYGRDSITVMSPYIPAMEIVFANDTCEASVVVSFSDRSWGVARDGKSMFNYNYPDARPLKEIYNSIDSAYHY